MKQRKTKIISITEKDYILANRKAAREEEIQEHGKIISLAPSKVHKSKKDYKRNKKVDIDENS